MRLITTCMRLEGTETGGAVFAGQQELEWLAAHWPMRRLVDVWNQLPGVRPVARFENRSVAVRRIWQALQEPNERTDADRRKQKANGPRAKRKLQLVLRMLRTPEGATLRALMKVTRWQAHSVRGFLSGKVSKHLSLPLESFKRDGERVYRLPASSNKLNLGLGAAEAACVRRSAPRCSAALSRGDKASKGFHLTFPIHDPGNLSQRVLVNSDRARRGSSAGTAFPPEWLGQARSAAGSATGVAG